MKLKLFTIPCIVLAIIFINASCSKGPTGATGPAGAAGPQGPAGPTGETGTANVIYSNWIDTVSFQPLYTDSSEWIAQITAPSLVDSILDKGEIKVYFNAGSDSTDDDFIVPIPITDPNVTGFIISPYYSLQTILISANGDASSYTSGGYHHFRYRYILIPGGVKIGGRTAKTINWKDYKQVKAYLGLKD